MADPQFQPANPALNPGLREWLDRRIDGSSMRRLKVEREALAISLKATGQAQPATILNFNPVPLVVDGGLANYKVPSILDKFVRDEDRFKVKYKGREYKATVLTIREPRLYPQIKDVKEVQGDAVAEYDMKACKQIEIVHAFKTAYTVGIESSSMMGGVVVFQGDRHVLERRDLDELEIQVPTYVLLPNRTREYYTEPKPFMDELAAALDMQKQYASIQTQYAQSCWDQEDQRGNITDIHRVWHQFEMDMNWRKKEAPWITLVHESGETCQGCGEAKKSVDAYFCKCGRPYDPMKAYLAGELPYDSHHLNRLNDADWKKVEAEETRRAKRRSVPKPDEKDGK